MSQPLSGGPLVPAWRFAGLLTCVILALLAFAAKPSAGRSSLSRSDALPRPQERLTQPIWLPHCQMRIVEWRPTYALLAETTPTSQSFATIDEACRDAFDRYDDFLRAKKLLRLHAQPDVLPAISLLPGNTLLDGKSTRALNDIPSRFEAVAPGCCYWGLYVDSLNHLFLRNDPLIKNAEGALVANPRFVRTLTHEISHVLSSRLGVWDVLGYDRKRDEDLAEEFVAYMGMRFPAESSAEDLEYHYGRIPGAVSEAPVKTEPPIRSAVANTSPQR
jgi:hypothetical protein